jgi:hypothetical protein
MERPSQGGAHGIFKPVNTLSLIATAVQSLLKDISRIRDGDKRAVSKLMIFRERPRARELLDFVQTINPGLFQPFLLLTHSIGVFGKYH